MITTMRIIILCFNGFHNLQLLNMCNNDRSIRDRFTQIVRDNVNIIIWN